MTGETSLAGRAIGFIGLGLMGRPMCRNLHAAGASLVVYNRTRATAETLAGALGGVRVADSPAAVAAEVETLIVNVADTAAVEQVLFGAAPSGAVSGLRPGGLVIDMGTTAVAATRRFADAVRARGGDYVDAPVSGGVIGAEEGTLAIMAGGSAAAFERALPILRVLGRNITRCGEVGAGQVAKIANQTIVGLTIGAVAEALALARRAGVDPAVLRRALAGGFADSRILELHGKRMADGAFTPGGKIVTQRKDIRLAQDLAREVGLDLPAVDLNGRLWDRMIEKGWGELDHSALIKLYEEEG
jgi:3-hydroxyisobutyrate dehydrogenase-like beta-hydroxyacid dehydrogenase